MHGDGPEWWTAIALAIETAQRAAAAGTGQSDVPKESTKPLTDDSFVASAETSAREAAGAVTAPPLEHMVSSGQLIGGVQLGGKPSEIPLASPLSRGVSGRRRSEGGGVGRVDGGGVDEAPDELSAESSDDDEETKAKGEPPKATDGAEAACDSTAVPAHEPMLMGGDAASVALASALSAAAAVRSSVVAEGGSDGSGDGDAVAARVRARRRCWLMRCVHSRARHI